MLDALVAASRGTTEKPASVRVAIRSDENALYDLLIDLHRENGRGWGYPYRPEIVLSRIETGTRPDPATRSDPKDRRRSIIGVIDGEDGKFLGSVCLMIEPAVWFTDAHALLELWLYVRRSVRMRDGFRHRHNLFRFCQWARDSMRAGIFQENPTYPYPVECFSGFMNFGRVAAMVRLWARHGEMCGALFKLK